MRTKLLIMLALLGVSSVTATAAESPVSGASASGGASTRLNELFEDYFERQLQLNPLLATFIGDHRYDDKLTNNISSRAHRHRARRRPQGARRRAEARRGSLSDADRLSVEIFMYDLHASIDGAKFPGELVPINQFQSLPTLMPVLGSGSSAQPFATAADYDRFLDAHARLHRLVGPGDREHAQGARAEPDVSARADGEGAAAAAGRDRRRSARRACSTQPLKKFPDAVAAADRTRLQAAYRDAITKEINPAYQRLHDFIRDEYLKGARTQVGWSTVPNGATWYAYLAQLSTTTDLTPDAIHELGLKEVARIRGEMEQVQDAGRLQGRPRRRSSSSCRTIRGSTTTTPTRCSQGYRDLKKNIDARLPKLFADFPKADYEVRAVEPFRATVLGRRLLSAAFGRRLAARHLLRQHVQPESAAEVRHGDAVAARGAPGPSLPGRDPAGAGRAAALPSLRQRLRRLPGRLGAVRGVHRQGAGHVHRPVSVLRAAERRDAARDAPGRRHRPAHAQLDAASRRSSTCSTTPRWRRATPSRKSSATSRSPARRSATRSASCASASCATRRRRRSAPRFDVREFHSQSCCATARCR